LLFVMDFTSANGPYNVWMFLKDSDVKNIHPKIMEEIAKGIVQVENATQAKEVIAQLVTLTAELNETKKEWLIKERLSFLTNHLFLPASHRDNESFQATVPGEYAENQKTDEFGAFQFILDASSDGHVDSTDVVLQPIEGAGKSQPSPRCQTSSP